MNSSKYNILLKVQNFHTIFFMFRVPTPKTKLDEEICGKNI